MQTALSNNRLRLMLGENADGVFVESIEVCTPPGWRVIAENPAGPEFASLIARPPPDGPDHDRAQSCPDFRRIYANATTCIREGHEFRLTAQTQWWEASEVISLVDDPPQVRRTQTYRFRKACDAVNRPGLAVPDDPAIRYTYPPHVCERRLSELSPLRCDMAWAVPFPFHIWRTSDWVALYGADPRVGLATLDFMPARGREPARLSVWHPGRTGQMNAAGLGIPNTVPQTTRYQAGDEVTLCEVLAARPLTTNQVPLLEAARLGADLLLRDRQPAVDDVKIADGIADFYRHCQLWNPDALGAGRGWFGNMWCYTGEGTPAKTGPYNGLYDLGWSEGYGVRAIVALTRHWRRTGRTDLLIYVDEMTRNLDCFRRSAGVDEPFYDRFHPNRKSVIGHDVPGGLGDFTGTKKIWTHSLAHIGHQLLRLYQDTPGYPNPAIRMGWRDAASSVARFLARQQSSTGDLPDGFNEQNQEANHKPHRIPARAVACGLWTLMAETTGEVIWRERALRLAKAVGPEIERYDFYNQMVDTLFGESSMAETVDAENAVYVLEGLMELYAVTGEAWLFRLIQHCAAYTFLWTYYYDLPTGYNGVTRGGTCCRMMDYPLIYHGASAMMVPELLRLAKMTGDPWYGQMAREMLDGIARYCWDAPDKPWHGSIVHAFDQNLAKHWGPDRKGQVDSGMTTGMSLIAFEESLDLARASAPVVAQREAEP